MAKENNHIKVKFLILLFMSMALSNYLQAQDWEGYGNGINYALIQGDTILCGYGRTHEKGSDYHESTIICENLNTGLSICEVVDNYTYEFKYNMNVEIAQVFDTISIYHLNGVDNKYQFIKDKLSHDNINLVKQIEIELYSGYYRKLLERTTIDFSGVIEVDDYAKDSIMKINITQDDIEALRNSIQHVNYTELNDIYGRRDNTGHEGEIGFRFITEDNASYYFISSKIPAIFRPLYMHVRDIKKVE